MFKMIINLVELDILLIYEASDTNIKAIKKLKTTSRLFFVTYIPP